MKIEGKHVCEACNREFEWMRTLPQPMNTPLYDVETIDRPQANIIEKREDGSYLLSIYCPHCDEPNQFEHRKKAP